MYSNASAIYGLKHQARSLAAQLGDTEHHRFLVGSMNVREENEIHLIEFGEDTNDLLCEAIYSFPHEIWHLSPSPTDPQLTLAAHHNGEDFVTSLLKLPTPAGSSQSSDFGHRGQLQPEKQPVEESLALPPTDGPANSVLWAPEEASSNSQIAALDHHTLKLWDMTDEAKEVCSFTVCEAHQASAAAWDPHQPSTLLTAHDCHLQTWDTRTSKQAMQMPSVHKFGVCDVDCNPNRPFYIVTGGQDRMMKFWDMRSPEAPVKILCGHSHWVWTVRYNRFHDQLLISAGTDSLLNLWRVSSISSAPLLELDGDTGGAKSDSADTKVRTFDEHEESIYSVAWSAYDAWMFASLSYDGSVVLNHVPSTEKYKILL